MSTNDKDTQRIRRAPVILLALTAVLLATAIVIEPRGDYPVFDDFFHKRVLNDSMEAGRYTPHTFVGSTIVLQIAWGAIFQTMLGDGYGPLRLSTLILAIIGAWAVARTALLFGAPRWAAILAGVCVIGNPIYLLLAYSYMTDVPFFCCVAVSMWLTATGYYKDKPWWVAGGVIAGFAAFFVRQHGLVAPAAAWTAAIYVLVIERRALRRQIWAALAGSTAAGFAIVALWFQWYPFTESQSTWIGTGEEWPATQRAAESIWFLAATLIYMGFYTLPIVAARVMTMRMPSQSSIALTAVCAAAIGIISIVWTRGMTRLPYMPHYLYDLGTGQIMFKGVWMIDRSWTPVSIGPVWWIVTAPALLGGAWILADGLQAAYRGIAREGGETVNQRAALMFVYALFAAFVVGYVPFLPRAFSDRYLLTALAPAAVVIAMSLSNVSTNRSRWAGIATAAFLVIVSTLLADDYFSMSRARWAARDWLIEDQGVDPLRIDGGFEYNGVYTLDRFMEETGATSFTEFGDHGFWLTDPPLYAIDLFDRDGFEVVKRFPYATWLRGSDQAVLVMKAADAPN